MYEMQHTSLQQHRREQLLSAHSNEKDDDLLLFREIQKRERDTTKAQPLHRGTLASIVPPKTTEDDIFASSEWDKHDYDWLITPPNLFLPMVKREPVANGFSLSGSAIARSSLKATSRIGSARSEPPSSAEPLVQIMRRSLDSQQAADPSEALTASTSSISQKSLSSSSSAPTRPSTPARSTTSVSRPVARPLTPSRSAASSVSIRSWTPTGRVATPANHPESSTRSSMPVKRRVTPTRVNNPSSTSVKSLTVNKATSLPSKSASSSRPSSPATWVRQLAAHPVAFPGTPQETPSNLRTSVVDWPLSNPRGSMALKTNTTAATKAPQPQPADTGARNNRQLSRSPFVTRGRVSSDSLNRETKAPQPQPVDTRARINRRLSSSPSVTRGRVSSDSLNGDKSLIRNGKPHDGVVVSNKMVDRIMPPRKSMPVGVNSGGKLPVKSTALRDMKSTSQDICGRTSFLSNISTSSLYSVRSGGSISTGCGNSTSSIASSPMATSSIASSEHGMSIVIDPESSELGDETSSEMGSRASPTSQSDPSVDFCNEREVTYWLGSPGYMDDTRGDIMEIFEQGLQSPQSPLISPQGGIIDCDDFVLERI